MLDHTVLCIDGSGFAGRLRDVLLQLVLSRRLDIEQASCGFRIIPYGVGILVLRHRHIR